MGAIFYITRGEYWFSNDGSEISPEEWLAVVESDLELKLAGFNGPYFAIWSGPSKYEEPWFDWQEGNIATKSPDEPILQKLLQLAERLKGTVQDDDGQAIGTPDTHS
jgi:hypothetical protein